MSEFYKKKRVVLFIALLASLAFIVAFIIFYGKTDLFRFPFDSNVWGTASDWAMVTVTFFTAMYLVRTFREQKKSNDIQIEKHLDSILPKFSIEQISFDFDDDYWLNIKLVKNDVRNIRFEICDHNIIHSVLDTPYFKEGEILSFNLNKKITSGYDSEGRPILVIYFEDIEHNSYKQSACVLNNKIYLERPILLL